MASAVEICNLALAHFGDEATVSSISPPDGSAQAAHCARFYPIARDALLELRAWDFATKRVALAQTTRTPPGAWTYEYAAPSDMIRPLAVLLADSPDETDSYDYVIEAGTDGARVLLCDVEDAYLRYTARVTDTAKFPPMFVTGLSYLLASYLVGPITKDIKAKQGLYELAMAEIGLAAVSNANAARHDAHASYTPGAVSARGFTTSPMLADGRILR